MTSSAGQAAIQNFDKISSYVEGAINGAANVEGPAKNQFELYGEKTVEAAKGLFNDDEK